MFCCINFVLVFIINHRMDVLEEILNVFSFQFLDNYVICDTVCGYVIRFAWSICHITVQIILIKCNN